MKTTNPYMLRGLIGLLMVEEFIRCRVSSRQNCTLKVKYKFGNMKTSKIITFMLLVSMESINLRIV